MCGADCGTEKSSTKERLTSKWTLTKIKGIIWSATGFSMTSKKYIRYFSVKDMPFTIFSALDTDRHHLRFLFDCGVECILKEKCYLLWWMQFLILHLRFNKYNCILFLLHFMILYFYVLVSNPLIYPFERDFMPKTNWKINKMGRKLKLKQYFGRKCLVLRKRRWEKYKPKWTVLAPKYVICLLRKSTKIYPH